MTVTELFTSTLTNQALDKLLENLHYDSFFFNETIGKRTITKSTTWAFSTPCSSVTTVQESTSTLLAARALAKAGNITLAWESIRALVSGQHEDGFLPKYRYNATEYTNSSIHSEQHDEYYIGNSTIPGPRLGSPLASLPLHASIVLDVFAWSEQTENDVQLLVDLYTRIYRYHQYMAEHRPYLSHPWESLWDPYSWKQPLTSLRQHLNSIKWKVPFKVPQQVLQSFDYHPDVYEPCVYLLLECLNNDNNSIPDSSGCRCLPNIWSVDFTAAWVQAHQDLLDMRRVIRDRHLEWMLVAMDPTLPSQWLTASQQRLESLWSDAHESFLPKQINPCSNNNTESMLVVSDASNFIALWPKLNDTSRLFRFASHLLQRDLGNDFYFDCGKHAIWSRGGCVEPSYISPIVNFLVSGGLDRNELHEISYFIDHATTNWLFPDSQQAVFEFPLAFHASTGLPFLHMDECSLHSTTTAAVVYDLATTTPYRVFHPDPPIRSSGVIVLIIVELIVALAIGASCLFLNLKMLRESTRRVQEEEDREDGFFSTVDSLGEQHRYEAIVENDEE